MLINLDSFAGIYPKLNEEKLPPNAAWEATGCNFNSGAVVGIRKSVPLPYPSSGPSPVSGFFFWDADAYGSYSFPNDVNAVHGPVVNDQHNRFYWTRNDGNEFRFGLYSENLDRGAGQITKSYKTGVISSELWQSAKISDIGLKVLTVPKRPPKNLDGFESKGLELTIVDKDGKQIQTEPLAYATEWTMTEVTDPDTGLNVSFTLTLANPIDTYAVEVLEVLDADGNVTTPATTITPYLAARWTLKRENQVASAAFYENKALSGTLDVGGGITASIVRVGTDGKSFSLTPEYGRDMPIEVRSYLITFVNKLGEESQPSAPWELQFNPGREDVVIQLDTTDLNDFVTAANLFADRYPMHGFRVYRTATASDGTADFLYVGTITLGDPGETLPGDVYDTFELYGPENDGRKDICPAGQLGAACPTQDCIRDTSELQKLRGLTAIHNNMLAAYKDNEVWVCEPGMPWIWKPAGIITLKHKVIAIASAEQGFYALTAGGPEYLSGNLPENIQSTKLPSILAPLNSRAVTTLKNQIIMASSDGLATISGLQVELAQAFSQEAWRDMVGDPATRVARLHAYGHRLLLAVPNSPNSYVFDLEDGQWSRMNERIDFAMQCPAGTFTLPTDNLVFTNGSGKWVAFAGDPVTRSWLWRSRVFTEGREVPMSCYQLFGKGTVKMTIYADDMDTPWYTLDNIVLSRTGTVGRLPGGLAMRYSVKFEATEGSELIKAQLAGTMEELRVAV